MVCGRRRGEEHRGGRSIASTCGGRRRASRGTANIKHTAPARPRGSFTPSLSLPRFSSHLSTPSTFWFSPAPRRAAQTSILDSPVHVKNTSCLVTWSPPSLLNFSSEPLHAPEPAQDGLSRSARAPEALVGRRPRRRLRAASPRKVTVTCGELSSRFPAP